MTDYTWWNTAALVLVARGQVQRSTNGVRQWLPARPHYLRDRPAPWSPQIGAAFDRLKEAGFIGSNPYATQVCLTQAGLEQLKLIVPRPQLLLFGTIDVVAEVRP